MIENAIAVIAKFFNVGEGKRPLLDFARELKALTELDREQLVTGILDGSLSY